METIIYKIRKLLQGYSPLALVFLTAPFFLPVDKHLHRNILLLFCAFPGILLTLVNPSCWKRAGLIYILLFVVFYEGQELRGISHWTLSNVRMIGMQALMILFPAIIISHSTSNRRLYSVAICIILFIAVISSICSMVTYYSEAPFPEARFEFTVRRSGNPIPDSWRSAFAAVLAGAFFIQTGPQLKRLDWFPLVCFPILLLTAFYSHSRSTALALMAALAVSILGVKKQIKKTLLLFAVTSAALLIYAGSLYFAPRQPGIVESASAPSLTLADSQEPTIFPTRSGGFLVAGEGGRIAAAGRLAIWRDHFSRMTSAKVWLVGHGLGKNCFVANMDSDAKSCYNVKDNVYQLHAHSGYIWALYHGGLIGLGLLLVLICTAGWNALRGGYAGYVSGALVVFSGTILLVETQRLLVGVGSLEYLIFWIPLALAAGIPSRNQNSCT